MKNYKETVVTSANALTKQVIRVLDLKGYKVWRQNNAGIFDNKLQQWRANSSTPGISDVIGFHRKTATFIAVEIKAGKDRLSIEQAAFLRDVNESGGIGKVVRNTTDIETLIKEIE